MNYYNEIDPHVAAWLQNLMDEGLIPHGKIDTRSITEVSPADLAGFTQCHFFAGIGGWSLALDLAGWPRDRPVWTGSCPCQPFSSAGKRKGQADERHLWPAFRRLIAACRPEKIWGEQVASSEVVGSKLEADFVDAVCRGDYALANKYANKLWKSNSLGYDPRWIDLVSAEMGAEGYACRFGVLGAHSVGGFHRRQRLYWVADANGTTSRGGELRLHSHNRDNMRAQGKQEPAEIGLADAKHGRQAEQKSRTKPRGGCSGMEHATGDGRQQRGAESSGRGVASGCGGSGMGDTNGVGRRKEGHASLTSIRIDRPSGVDWIACRDGKTRPIEPGIEPLVNGVSFRLADGRTRSDCSRAKILHGLGNAIVPQVAAAFIKAHMSE